MFICISNCEIFSFRYPTLIFSHLTEMCGIIIPWEVDSPMPDLTFMEKKVERIWELVLDQSSSE